MEALAAGICAGPDGQRNRAAWRLIHFLVRVNAYVHQKAIEELGKSATILFEEPTAAAEGMLALHTKLWEWRKSLGDAQDNRYWRSARFGNGIAGETEIPPEPETPDLWPRVQDLLASVAATTEAEAKHALALQTQVWCDFCQRSIDETGPVWSTVSGRERRWYLDFLGPAVSQPSKIDQPQNIGAGSARGQYWKVGKYVITDGSFNRMRNKLPQEQLQASLRGLRDDASAYASAIDEATDWVRLILRRLKPREGGGATAMGVMDKYATAYLPALKALGPPPYPSGENGGCDGSKLLEGFEDAITRKGTLLGPWRWEPGDLRKPRRVLLTGSKRKASGEVEIVEQWIPTPK
jgi:hypothetical protein